MNPTDPLAALRDIHAPTPSGFWPPAPGWIVVGCLLVAAGVAAVIIAVRWWRGGRARRTALAHLRTLGARHQAGANGTEIAVELSALIRRVALTYRPREEVAGLTGERWLAYLESNVPEIGASARAALLDAPYARGCDFDVPRALTVCTRWIRRA